MTLEEFSFEFDVMYNNITSNQAPGLSELEKSIFLTQAQELLVKQYYKGNYEQSFENTEEVTQYLNSLVSQKIYTATDKASDKKGVLLSNKLKQTFFEMPNTEKVMFITYEAVELNGITGKDALVVPTTQDEFYNVHNNPFRGPSKNRVVRLIRNNVIELYSTNDVKQYLMRYIKYPDPIILPNSGELSPYSDNPEGVNTKLPESLHRNILMQAVALAKAAWTS